MNADVDRPGWPDGLRADRHREPTRFSSYANWLSLLLLGLVLGVALTGWLGGGPDPVRRTDAPAAAIEIAMPSIIRNGEFFETNIEITARQPISDPVIRLAPSLWQDITINTVFPEPAEQEFVEGWTAYHYDPLETGDRLVIKLDAQINPPLFAGTSGAIALYDGDRRIASLPLTLRVMP